MLRTQKCEPGGSSLASALLPLFRAHEANKNEFRGPGTKDLTQTAVLEGGRLLLTLPDGRVIAPDSVSESSAQ